MDYNKAVKHKLVDLGKTKAWLFEQVKERTGLYCDNSYFLKICRGEEPGVKIVAAINEILGLEGPACRTSKKSGTG